MAGADLLPCTSERQDELAGQVAAAETPGRLAGTTGGLSNSSKVDYTKGILQAQYDRDEEVDGGAAPAAHEGEGERRKRPEDADDDGKKRPWWQPWKQQTANWRTTVHSINDSEHLRSKWLFQVNAPAPIEFLWASDTSPFSARLPADRLTLNLTCVP